MEDKLTLLYAQRVWTSLSDDHFRADLEKSLARFCMVKGFPRDRWHDFNYTLYVFCAGRAGEFDENRACLKTWMILQARRLMTNIIRDHGWASLTFGWEEVNECDLCVTRDKYQEETHVSLEDLLFTSDTPERILIRQDNKIAQKVINREVMAYAEMLGDQEKACLDLLLATGFEVTNGELASSLSLGSEYSARKLRKRLYGELGLRLLHFGINLETNRV